MAIRILASSLSEKLFKVATSPPSISTDGKSGVASSYEYLGNQSWEANELSVVVAEKYSCEISLADASSEAHPRPDHSKG